MIFHLFITSSAVQIYEFSYIQFHLIAVSLQLNGMLMMWKIQQTMQDNADFIPTIHPAFIPLSSRLPRSRLEKSRSREPSQPTLSYEHIENFTKDSEVRRDLGNRASPVNRAHMKRPWVANLLVTMNLSTTGVQQS